MNPLFQPFLHLYAPKAHPTYPWWVRGRRWRRADGQGFLAHGTAEDDVRRHEMDAELPLARPPLLPTQVWARPDGSSVSILSVVGDGSAIVAVLQLAHRPSPLAGGHPQPGVAPALGLLPALPPDAVLVCGPSCYGRDVPWMDTARLPPFLRAVEDHDVPS